ncbi:RDD family protein [Micromonospora costi]|uniref:RDD family protein n=1 Tax=Micromonospora costi TaxID=1530042 RepID=A0A3B0A2A4_9ACTN|nr:RDD family protein [Micromonospora costi]RKN54444.1 RDD family protein [Micromonospora costi]
MTQPPSYPTPPAGGPWPTAGGFAPPAAPQPYGVPPQYAPPGYPPPGYPYQPTPPPVITPAGQPLASFADRLLAWLLDMVIAAGVMSLLFMPVFLVIWWNMVTELSRMSADGTSAPPDPAMMITDVMLPLLLAELGLLVLTLVLYWLYHVEYLLRHGGQTLGKKVMKIRVVPLDPTRALDRGLAGRRWLVQHLGSAFVPGLSYLDGLWQLWDKPWQQCLHDRFAGTVVVKVSA